MIFTQKRKPAITAKKTQNPNGVKVGSPGKAAPKGATHPWEKDLAKIAGKQLKKLQRKHRAIYAVVAHIITACKKY